MLELEQLHAPPLLLEQQLLGGLALGDDALGGLALEPILLRNSLSGIRSGGGSGEVAHIKKLAVG